MSEETKGMLCLVCTVFIVTLLACSFHISNEKRACRGALRKGWRVA